MPAPLSRDHHRALERCREEERLHFRLEEEVLLPAYATYGDPINPMY